MKRNFQIAIPLLVLIASGAGLALSAPDLATWSVAMFPTVALQAISFGALTLLPGLALMRLLWPAGTQEDGSRDSIERSAIALALGLALPPLLLLMCRLLGLTWTRTASYIYVLAAGIIWASGLRRASFSRPRWSTALLLLMLSTALFARMYTVRDLPTGLFGDSYHHTMVTQLLVDNGGLFSSWAPYAPMTTFTYHYGFHANAAFYHWFTGVPVLQAVVHAGQLLNASAMLAAYALLSRLARSGSNAPSAVLGLLAAAFTGFVNPHPAFFVNWGRYTQLAGQVMLPGLLLCWVQLIDNATSNNTRSERDRWRTVLLCGLSTAGMMLTHYIVTLFAALMVGVYVLVAVLKNGMWRPAGRTIALCVAAALIALILAGPWLQNTLTGNLTRNTNSFVSGSAGAARIASYSALRPIVPDYLNRGVLWLAVAGLGVAIARRAWRVAMLAMWSGLLLLSITPGTLGLPGSGVIDTLTGYIALYVTVTPLAAYGAASIGEWLLTHLKPRQRNDALLPLSATVACVTLAVWGAGWQRSIVNTAAYQLVAPADMRAMEWIRATTPAEARFLVNAFPAYDGTLIAGSDAGWWLPFLSGRQSSLPPLAYGSERGVSEVPAMRDATINLWIALRGAPLADARPVCIDVTRPDALALLRAQGITHVYSGAERSPERENADYIDTSTLRSSDAFQIVYDKDGVEIFAMR